MPVFSHDSGVTHLKEVFYRVGFSDKDILALSGSHTLGAAETALLDDPVFRHYVELYAKFYQCFILARSLKRRVEASHSFLFNEPFLCIALLTVKDSTILAQSAVGVW
ncbi:L-ascorbate peroxidase 3-like [Nicotiana tabacum]|uniref:L-ascorbate peroxidase 3-like n=1 Tax=Nicotiana tabacum TaxID=4097 RepID=A0AC58U2E1_TOBAC